MQLCALTIKRILITAFIVTTVFAGLNHFSVAAFSTGPLAARTGAPALGRHLAELDCRACHFTEPLNDPDTTFFISAQDNYTPGTDVPVKVTILRGQLRKFGFQLTALDDQGNKAGELVLTEPARTQLQSADGRQYINHTATGNAAIEPGLNSWSFIWRPPAQAVGRVIFYAAGNATNGNGSTLGDFVSTTTKALDAPGFTPQAIAVVSAASFASGATSESIMALFGNDLAATGIAAATSPLPTTLGGLRVIVHDLDTHIERDAPLFYAGPNQINFQIPPGVTNGTASISVLRNNTIFAGTEITISTVAPAFFTANADGRGVPAAVALPIKGGTVLAAEPVAQSINNRYEPLPIELGATDVRVFLVAFGTGFRNRGVGGTLSATIGGINVEVAAGAQGQFIGLDQANLLIPRSLIGRGVVDVILTVNGKASNTVQINVN